jgi:hypothetical protein
VVESLPSKSKALTSNPNTKKTKQNKILKIQTLQCGKSKAAELKSDEVSTSTKHTEESKFVK